MHVINMPLYDSRCNYGKRKICPSLKISKRKLHKLWPNRQTAAAGLDMDDLMEMDLFWTSHTLLCNYENDGLILFQFA